MTTSSRSDVAGPLPPGWTWVRTRFLCDIETGTSDTVDGDPDGEFPFFVRSDTVERANSHTHDLEVVLTADDGAGVGRAFHHYSGKFLAHQRVYVFSKFHDCTPRYFYYYFSMLFGTQVLEGTAKSTVESLRRPMLADFQVALPDVGTQDLIVRFLDRETAKIDALIAKQEQLVTTLLEHRASLVASAVMHPAGGTRLKHFIVGVRQGWSPQCAAIPADGVTEWGVLKTGCMNGGVFRPSKNKLLPADEEPRPELVVRKGEIVMSRASTRERVGSAAVVVGEYPRLMLSDLTYALTVNSARAIPEFVALVLGTPQLRGLIESAPKQKQEVRVTRCRRSVNPTYSTSHCPCHRSRIKRQSLTASLFAP